MDKTIKSGIYIYDILNVSKAVLMGLSKNKKKSVLIKIKLLAIKLLLVEERHICLAIVVGSCCCTCVLRLSDAPKQLFPASDFVMC